MLAGRDDYAVPGTGVDINVWINAALADEFQFIQPLKQGGLNLGPFTYKYQDFRFFQPLGQLI